MVEKEPPIKYLTEYVCHAGGELALTGTSGFYGSNNFLQKPVNSYMMEENPHIPQNLVKKL